MLRRIVHYLETGKKFPDPGLCRTAGNYDMLTMISSLVTCPKCLNKLSMPANKSPGDLVEEKYAGTLADLMMKEEK